MVQPLVIGLDLASTVCAGAGRGAMDTGYLRDVPTDGALPSERP